MSGHNSLIQSVFGGCSGSMGFLIDQGSAANFVPINTADNWLHAYWSRDARPGPPSGAWSRERGPLEGPLRVTIAKHRAEACSGTIIVNGTAAPARARQ